MKKLVKKVLSSVAVAMLVCACGNSSPKPADQGPRVLKGTTLAMAVADVKGGPFQSVSDQMQKMFENLQKNAKDAEAANQFLKQAGLEEPKVRWGVLTVGEIGDVSKEMPEINYAVSFDHDAERIFKALQETLAKEKDAGISIKTLQVAGRKAWQLDGENFKGTPGDIRPYLTSIDGKILLASSCEAGLKHLIDLYVSGQGADEAWSDFKVSPANPFKIRTMPLGQIVAAAGKEANDNLGALDALVPDGAKLVRGLGMLTAGLRASEDGKKGVVELSLGTAKDEDADTLVTLAKTGLMTLTASLQEAAKTDAESKDALDVVKTIKLNHTGALVKLELSFPLDLVCKSLEDALKDMF